MVGWLSKKRQEAKRKEADEQKLKDSISEKLAEYEASREVSPDDPGDNDHTELVVDGKKLRVPKTQIDLSDD